MQKHRLNSQQCASDHREEELGLFQHQGRSQRLRGTSPREIGDKACYDKEKVCLVQVVPRAHMLSDKQVRTNRNALPHKSGVSVEWMWVESPAHMLTLGVAGGF